MRWIEPDWPAPKHVRAFTTTRSGGFSDAPYASFNLAMHVGDDPLIVEKNRRHLQLQASLPQAPRWLTQYHSTVILAGDDIMDAPQADASYTTNKQVVLAILTADCLPVLICDRQGTVVVAIHAGWRGLLDGVIIESLRHVAAAPEDCLAWLGPAISMPAYAIGEEVRAMFLSKGFPASAFSQRQGQWHMDLYALAREQLNQLGITAIYGGQYCTYGDGEQFYSYRRDGVTGRMASLIWMS